MNGKGMNPRKGYNNKLYGDNYNRVFRPNDNAKQAEGTAKGFPRKQTGKLFPKPEKAHR